MLVDLYVNQIQEFWLVWVIGLLNTQLLLNIGALTQVRLAVAQAQVKAHTFHLLAILLFMKYKINYHKNYCCM